MYVCLSVGSGLVGWSVVLESFDKRLTHMYTFVDVYDNVEIFVMLISLIAQRCD